MSMDGLDNPVASTEQPKSGKKFWLFGGCGLGCLGLIGLCCVGLIGAGYFYGWKPMQDFQTENINSAIISPEAEEALGTPIETQAGIPEQTGPQSFTFRVPVSGPKASGTLVIKGTLEGVNWIRDEIYLDVNGEQIDLDPESMFEVEIIE